VFLDCLLCSVVVIFYGRIVGLWRECFYAAQSRALCSVSDLLVTHGLREGCCDDFPFGAMAAARSRIKRRRRKGKKGSVRDRFCEGYFNGLDWAFGEGCNALGCLGLFYTYGSVYSTSG
jgi:hypothetical protein